MIAARSVKRRSVSDSDVIVVCAAFILPPARHYLHASRQLASHLDWREPIGLQERLEGRSSHNGEILRHVSFPLSGNQGYDSNRSVLLLALAVIKQHCITASALSGLGVNCLYSS